MKYNLYIMKTSTWTQLAFCLLSSVFYACNSSHVYYLDATSGSDQNNGTSPRSAWGGERMYFQRIRDLREDKDKTQQEIADFLHMQRSIYRRYELGEREIPVWALIRLAEYYGVSTDYLLGLKEQA